ncbi:restriction endonuclease subunit S [Collinsella sp. AGMB00827]|uniref:Restriction endonuclease subunit S n=1 Tax=Collinsella ureilytica TaxID=2869515 RepID=A0ABS7MJV7_9ACTN|nr:restriction endonuclease subunit S [Collinsella urealyticum]MBY4797318.1 restriction endonuclease subunit S [Collinsella urealyticum]
MDTKKLRQKLLDLAIRGKLVPQDPNDEPASELLSRIHEEKLTMVERGELKPKDVKNDTVIYFGSDGLPYEKRADGKGEAKCIDKEILFDLPEGWSWTRVNAVCPVGTGATPLKANKAYYENGTIPWITSGSATKGVIIEPDGYITELALRETNCVVYPVESLVVAMYGEGKTRGSVATLRIDAATNQACAVLRKIEKGCLQSYIKICYENSYDALREKAQGGNQPNLNQSVVSNLLIPVPPLAEQRRIVDALGKYLALVDGIERDRAELDVLLAQLKSKVLDLAVRSELTERDQKDEPASELLARIREEKLAMVGRGELKSKDVKNDTVIFTGSDGLRYEKPADGKGGAKCIEKEIPFEVPEGWSWSRMERLIQLTSGIDLAKADYNSEHNGIPYITGASNFENGSLIENRWTDKPKRISHRGDLLFTCKGTVGKMAINKFASAHIARQVMAINPYRGVDKLYLQQVLAWHVETIRRKAKGFIPGIERGVLLKALVPVPPLAEQRRIVRAIEAVTSATSL